MIKIIFNFFFYKKSVYGKYYPLLSPLKKTIIISSFGFFAKDNLKTKLSLVKTFMMLLLKRSQNRCGRRSKQVT